MKDKRGFTIVELSAVIVLIMLLAALIASRVIDIDSDSKQKILDAKMELILDSAVKYGTDHIDELKTTETDLKKRKCTKEVTVNTLIQMNYLQGDDEYGYQLINPITNDNMNNIVVCVGYVDRKIVSDFKTNVYSS